MRGEHLGIKPQSKSAKGSSPHARGARAASGDAPGWRGIIPACAGSTGNRSSCPLCPWDHPRMRGEHRQALWPLMIAPGSSPHARGALDSGGILRTIKRIIPACAGSTHIVRTIRQSAWDHPRMRGEHSTLRSFGCLTGGIIPACAGSTAAYPDHSCRPRDHPRMRGEHIHILPPARSLMGSSPHARGALLRLSRETSPQRIIPACAGSTSPEMRAAERAGDHPRMRGEHPQQTKQTGLNPGSSPHARGAHALYDPKQANQGIIPACAGSTAARSNATHAGRDHPRMRGEHTGCPCLLLPKKGSSPHARGAHVMAREALAICGIIPACAGSTTITR